MAGMTRFLERKILGHLLLKQRYDVPSNLYLALLGKDGKELTGKGYSRQVITFGKGQNDDEVKSNVTAQFPVAQDLWGEVVATAIFDSIQGGNILYSGEVGNTKKIEKNDQIRFDAGNITIKIGE